MSLNTTVYNTCYPLCFKPFQIDTNQGSQLIKLILQLMVAVWKANTFTSPTYLITHICDQCYRVLLSQTHAYMMHNKQVLAHLRLLHSVKELQVFWAQEKPKCSTIALFRNRIILMQNELHSSAMNYSLIVK